MTNILQAWKIGQKLNYSEFKRINLTGPTEQVIKRWNGHTRLGGTKACFWVCFENAKNPIDPQFSHQIATVHGRDYLHHRLINQSHTEISICITKCTMSARSSAAVWINLEYRLS